MANKSGLVFDGASLCEDSPGLTAVVAGNVSGLIFLCTTWDSVALFLIFWPFVTVNLELLSMFSVYSNIGDDDERLLWWNGSFSSW